MEALRRSSWNVAGQLEEDGGGDGNRVLALGWVEMEHDQSVDGRVG